MSTPSSDRGDPGLYGRSFADVYDDWYGQISDPSAVVRACRKRLGTGSRIVEFGSGSGRLSAPLADIGFDVVGIDASVAMVRRAPITNHHHSVGADMADVGLASGCADLVLIAYNTLFNVETPERQQRCLDEARRLLRPNGRLAIECFIATPVDAGSLVTTTVRNAGDEEAVVIITQRERATQRSQRIVGSHIELRTGDVICRPWELYYRPPGELDIAAQAAGLDLAERFADWSDAAFDPLGPRHVSWYRRRD